jgi:HSP20 family molecular chaperone IbpA
VEVPGFTKENLSMEINHDGSEISLKGKSETRELNQSLVLPSKIEPKSVKSTITNGILEIRGKKTSENTDRYQLKIE